jgi:hypothetical protein
MVLSKILILTYTFELDYSYVVSEINSNKKLKSFMDPAIQSLIRESINALKSVLCPAHDSDIRS